MENQEYVIKGVVEGMISVLEKDFDMPFEEAKFFVYILLNQNGDKGVSTIEREQLNLWYLSKQEKYESQILNTHFSISFSASEKSTYRIVYIFLAKYFFGRGIDLVSIGIDLIYIIASAIHKIKDTDYCIYSRIAELCIGNKERLFSISEIAVANKDGKCDYQEDNWKCTYLGQQENCTCNKEKVALAFSSLEEQGAIQPVGERWRLVK